MIAAEVRPSRAASFSESHNSPATRAHRQATCGSFVKRLNAMSLVASPMGGAGLADASLIHLKSGTQFIANAVGLAWTYSHPNQVMDEIARLTPSFAGHLRQ